ncbi:MAG: hypothetical protein ACT6S0_00065 [Roseateles sp.]|uniref:hypothetical protein n=1 Tax=Roseateles sp. TaxID=1971397 RepID=UPI004036A14C
MKPARHRALRVCAAMVCALLAPGAALAAAAAARASATVVLPASVNAWLGVPVSVEALLQGRDLPAGPATGALVPRSPAAPPPVLDASPQGIAAAIDGSQAAGMDAAAAAAATLSPSGPAVAVSVAADSGASGRREAPLVITVAFN